MYVAVLRMQERQDLHSDSDVGRHRKTTNSTVRRQPRTCPLKHCRKSVVNIPRHLRTVHKWSDNDAKFAVATLGLRNAYKLFQNLRTTTVTESAQLMAVLQKNRTAFEGCSQNLATHSSV